MSRSFPIHSREWHEEALRDLDTFDPSDREAQILITWHSTAANYWQYGEFHDLDGPAAEVDGKPVRIKPFFQLGIDDNGYPFMRHFPLDEVVQTLDYFDVGGIRLRDVTITSQANGRVSYRVPDCVDQGGAIRQFRVSPNKLLAEYPLTDPVLKSDIQEACETHVREGGLSE